MSTTLTGFQPLAAANFPRSSPWVRVAAPPTDLVVLTGGGLLAACLFLPLISPSHEAVGGVFWTQLILSCTSFPVETDAAVFGLLGMVMPYGVGLLLAASAAARLLRLPRMAAVCRAFVRATLIFMGVGVLWALPCLYLEELRDESLAGLFVSSVVLAGVFLWGVGRVKRGRRLPGLKTDLCLSLGCLIWFGFLFVTVPLEYGAYVAITASALLVATHLVELRACSESASQSRLPGRGVPRSLDTPAFPGYSISIES